MKQSNQKNNRPRASIIYEAQELVLQSTLSSEIGLREINAHNKRENAQKGAINLPATG